MTATDTEEPEIDLSAIEDGILTLTSAVNRAAKAMQPPVVNVTQAAQSPPNVNVAVPEQKQAKGFTMDIARDPKGMISSVKVTFVW